MKFPEYKNLDLAKINHEVLQQWKNEGTFAQSLKLREAGKSFVFYEGPPSANGMPGIHHVMARAVKDTFCRYKTLKGYLVQRKAGWDTHGLPVELGVEKMLGITKEDIGKKISVDDYNAACRREVMKYTKEWENLTEQMGYWVDMQNPYVTYDNRYIETLWYLLKQLYKKNLLYKGYTIQPYSPAAGTGLSTHELNQPGCYRDVKDTTCVAMFRAAQVESQKSQVAHRTSHIADLPTYFLAWTTTPWTLPSNTALCVGSSISYCFVKTENPYTSEPCIVVLAKDLVGHFFGEKRLANFEIVSECKGADLEGRQYEQLFPWVNPNGAAFRVITGDFVTTDDGTGIVHIAPTFGADDDRVAKQNNIAPLMLVDKNGIRQPMVDKTGKFFRLEDLDETFVHTSVDVNLYRAYAGRFVKNDYDPKLGENDSTLDIDLCVMLKQQGKVFKIEKHVHSYPHCWRTDKPVLYYPLDSWFIRSTACKERMVELNKTIAWKPESTGTGRFGKWLEELKDWNLSRSRYWGTPLPIWRSEDGSEEMCVGSVEELVCEAEKSVAAGFMKANPYAGFRTGDGYHNIDLHRPYVDDIILVSPTGKAMRRELDLIDVWFDSGAMPFAQLHYPFENKNLVESGAFYPADFISEGVDQTRGWFFTLHAISAMFADSVAFKNVISTGLVLDKNGNKMSKRLGNAVEPFAVMNEYGSDALRWYMLTNSQPWDNLKFDIEGVDEVRRKFFGTLHNTYSFFALYANVDGYEPPADLPAAVGSCTAFAQIDRWIISLLNTLIGEVEQSYESYEPTRAGRLIQDFVCDHLSNWYVRLNRKRFWGGDMTDDKRAAYLTLYHCLRTVCLLASPIAPFVTDRIFRDLSGGSTSVHLADFPVHNSALINADLEQKMQVAQQVTSMILALRRKADIKVRQPLAKVIIPVADKKLVSLFTDEILAIIRNETNVKHIDLVSDDAGVISKRAKANFKTLGAKCGKNMKEVAAKILAFSQREIATLEHDGHLALSLASGEIVELLPDNVDISTEDIAGSLSLSENGITLALDITVTTELRLEGIARELVNRIQNLRKDSGFEVTDRIHITLQNAPQIREAVNTFSPYIKGQVLATELQLVDSLPSSSTVDMDGYELGVALRVVR